MKDYNGEEIDDLAWQGCSNYSCQQCGKLIMWLKYQGHIEKIDLLFCPDCFEDDSK